MASKHELAQLANAAQKYADGEPFTAPSGWQVV